MSFDLAIWRRSPTTKTAMIEEVYDLLGLHDRDHPAAGMFDTLASTITALLPLVVERNLMLYDAQAKAVYNNRRHYPSPSV